LSSNLLIKTIGSRPGQESSPVFKYSQVVELCEAELDIEIYDLGVGLSLAPIIQTASRSISMSPWENRCLKISYRWLRMPSDA